MSDYVNGLLGKLIELSLEEKRIAADIDAAHKEYTDYCADSEMDLNKKIEEIHDKMNKLDRFIDYARQHADPGGLEQATAPFDTPEGTLESIRQTIKLDSNNDPNAETLFTKATGKKLYYEQEIERTRKLIEGSKVQAKRQYDSDVAKLNNSKEEHLGRVREYVQSGEFSDYLKFLVYDKSAFNSPGTINLNDDDRVSLGQRRVRMSVPMDIEQDVAISSNGEYNAAARTIGAPYYISSKMGGTLFLEHDERNGQYLLGGVQRLLLNFVKYFGDNLSSILFCEPDRFSVESLGNISALGKGINPLITVPKTMEEASDKLMKFAAKAEAAPTPNMVSRILVLQDFPEKYSPDIVNKVVEMCKNAEQSGVLVVLTHGVPMEIVPAESEIRGLAEVIRSRNGGFWVERLHESLFWYSAPSDISEEVRQKYVEKRRQDALKAAQEPAPVEEPKPAEPPVTVSAPAPAPYEAPKPAEPPVTVGAPASAPYEAPKPAEPPVTVSAPAPAPYEAPKPAEPPVTVSAPAPAPYEAPKPAEPPVTVSAPAPAPYEAPKPAEPPVTVSAPAPAPYEAPKPAEPPVTVSAPAPAPYEAPKPAEPPVTVSVPAPAPVEEPKPAEPPVMVSAPAPAPVEEPKPAEPPVMVSAPAPAPVEEPKPAEPPVMVSAPEPVPVEEPKPAELPVTVSAPASVPVEEPRYEEGLASDEMTDAAEMSDAFDFDEQDLTEENEPKTDEFDMSEDNESNDYDNALSSLSTDENGEPIPAHILFSVPRPKPEQKDVTMTVLSELNDQLPPPVEEPEPVMEDPFDYVDYRPAQKLDPELTYRITDRPAVKPADPVPAPAPEPEKTRASILDVIDAGRRKIGAFVDNRKADIAAKRAEQAVETPTPSENIVTPAADVTAFVPDDTYTPTSTVNTPELSSEPAAEPVPVPEPVVETPPVEEVFVKGKRKLPEIPIGKNVDGELIDLNISGGITYICGNRSDERKTIVERVISQITADTHPDDVELWLFDCGEGDFIKYTDAPDEHIKYLVSDIGADTAADVADIISDEMERRVEMFTDNGWASMDDVPADVFMPRIVVAVNAFPKFSENIFGTQKYFGRNYNNRLSNMFKRGISYGIHFLLIGDKFSENGEYPACLEGCSIYSAVAVSGRDRYAHLIFSSIKMYDNEKESLKNIPAGCAFTADENSPDGLTLVRISGEHAVNRHTYKKVSEYSENVEEYLDKMPFIGDRRSASRFDDLSDYRAEQIKAREEDECLLFLGEPCRFMGQYPVRLFDDFGENILTIAPTRDKGSVALVVRAALHSLEEQGIKAEILAGRGNPVYKELIQTGELDNITVFEGARAEERIKDIANLLDAGDRSDVFEVILGGDLLVASMNADDMLPVLKRALVNGPRMGVHFMFVSGSIAQMETGFLSLFRHKLVYACPYSEAEKLLRDPNCELPENGFRLSNDYDELTLLPYQM